MKYDDALNQPVVWFGCAVVASVVGKFERVPKLISSAHLRISAGIAFNVKNSGKARIAAPAPTPHANESIEESNRMKAEAEREWEKIKEEWKKIEEEKRQLEKQRAALNQLQQQLREAQANAARYTHFRTFDHARTTPHLALCSL